jgi:hypothetical protein
MARLAWHHAEALIRATVRVERRRAGGWRHAGTAFFVAENLLVTCAHLVQGDDETRVVTPAPDGARTIAVTVVRRAPDVSDDADHYPLPDVALLQVTAVGDAFTGPIPRLDERAPGDDLLAYGYTDEYREGQVLGHSGRFQLAGEEEATAGAPGNLLRMKGDRVRRGMSGSPVLDLLTGAVVGMVKRTQHETLALGAFFVPVSMLLLGVPEAAAAGRQRDPAQLACELWGNLFHTAGAVLAGSPGARSWLARALAMERELHGDEVQQAGQLAAALFRLDLERLAETVQGLVPILGRATANGALRPRGDVHRLSRHPVDRRRRRRRAGRPGRALRPREPGAGSRPRPPVRPGGPSMAVPPAG